MASTNQLTVAQIEPVGGHSGMDYYDFGLAQGLANAGVDVWLYTCDETQPPPTVQFTTKLTYQAIFGDESAWKRGIRYLVASLKSIVDAKRNRASISHFHFFHVGPLELFNVLLAKLMGFKVIATAHDINAFAGVEVPIIAKWVYHLADGVIAHNQISKDEIVSQLDIEENLVYVIPHGNYLHSLPQILSKTEARQQLNLPQEAKVLLFFGQIKKVKGLDILLKALSQVVKHHPDVVLLIAGRPWKDDFSKYEAIMHAHQLGEICQLHIRYIENDEVNIFFGAADLILLPYRRIYQSGVLLMAMSYERPILASNIDGMTEVVRHKQTGYLFQSEDENSLAAMLIKLLCQPEEMELIAQNGYQLVQQQYDWNSIGRQTLNVYKKILHQV